MNRHLRTSLLMLAIAAGAFLSTPSFAQLQSVQLVKGPTYSAGITALAPAASASDIFLITGSATATIRVTRIECSGISTASATPTVALVKRSTANTGGTSTTPTVVPHDSNDVAGTAVVRAYTANPTAGTLVGLLRTARMTTGETASSTNPAVPLVWRFGDFGGRPIVLRGVAQSIAVNGAGNSFAAGTSLNCNIEWNETAN